MRAARWTLCPRQTIMARSSVVEKRSGGRSMREPYVVPMQKSPLALDVSASERRERRLAQSTDIWTDESRMMIAFSGEEDVEALLNDPRFGAVAMPVLALSGVTDGPLYEMWSLLMFGKDGEEHK